MWRPALHPTKLTRRRQTAAFSPKGVDLTRRSRPSAFFSIVHAFLHGLCQLLLVLRQQCLNLVVRFVADRVNLRAQVLACEFRIFIEQSLNPVVVLLEQGSDLFSLAWGEFQILGQMIEFLIDGPRAVDTLVWLRCIFLGYGNAGHPERQHASQCNGEKRCHI